MKQKFYLRNIVQIVFALISVFIGINFILFVNHYLDHSLAVSRPAGVEGFLPISALVSLKAWLTTGNFDRIHPAGLVILLAVLFISLLLKKSFCSWICPIGTLSDGLARMGRFFFNRNFKVPRFLDYPLRSLKYLLFLFFFSTVFLGMSGAAAAAFLQSPYNMVADVKMLQFFETISGSGLLILGLLVVLSILFENFWCRYLCPYGALTGLISIVSPVKITRQEESCINCGACTKACPNRLEVSRAKRVWSPECNGCLNCVSSCPIPDTLRFKPPITKAILSPRNTAIAVIGIWILFIIIAKLTGHWQTSITDQMYRALIPNAANYTH